MARLDGTPGKANPAAQDSDLRRLDRWPSLVSGDGHVTTYHTIELGDRGLLAPGRWRWARAIGWMAVLFVAMVTLSGPPPPAFAELTGIPIGTATIISGLLPLVMYVVYAGLVRWAERRAPSELSLRALPLDLVIGLAIGTGMFVLVFTILRLTGAYSLESGQWADWPSDILKTLSTGFREELIARLVVFRLVMRAFGLWPALAFSALTFGLGHLGNPNASTVAALAIAVEAGLMLAGFYILTGRIWMAVGVHAAWNFAQGPIFGARISGFTESGSLFVSAPVVDTPDWLSGGPFGPEASVPAIIVGSLVFIVVILAARRRRLV